MRQKTYEQLQAEDAGSKGKWGYDDQGNKVMLIGEDGEQLAPEELKQEMAAQEEEEEEDPMQGLVKLTKDIKAQTEKAKADKQNLFGYREKKIDKGKKKDEMKKEKDKKKNNEESKVGKERGKGILKSASEPDLGPRKKSIRFAPEYDKRGVEVGSPKGGARERLSKARGR